MNRPGSAHGTTMATMFRWVAAGLVLAAGSAFARDAAQDVHSIARAEATLCDAYEANDADFFRDNLDDRYTRTDTKGVVTDRAHEIAAITRRDPVYAVFRKHDQTIRVYGDAAVVNGITTIQSHSGAMKFEGEFQYTDTWIHADGRWKLAASHTTLLRTRYADAATTH